MAGANDVDEVAGGSRTRRAPGPALLVVAGGMAAGLVAAVHGCGGPGSSVSGPPLPAPSHAASAGSSAVADSGSVFLEHLAGCARTDFRHDLVVAVGVTNLGARSLRVLGAVALGETARLQLTAVRIGRAPCAVGGGAVPVRLPPSGAVVIALSFRVRGGCPGATELAARVVFEDGGRIVHADSSQLADLSALRFPGCSRRVAFRGAAGRQRRLYD